jgi:spore maturation protein CgeB
MDIWEINLKALANRPKEGDLLPVLPAALPILKRVSLLPGPTPSLKISREEGRPITFHSPRNAWKEAEALVKQAPLNDSQPLVALGLGLGYHLLSLLPLLSPEQPLIIVEPEEEIFWAALSSLELTPLFTRPHTYLVVHPDSQEVIQHLRQRLGLGNGRSVGLWGHPPSLRAANDFYQAVITDLKPPAPQIRPPRGLKKEKLRILIFNPDYFLVPEAMRAFTQLGHEVGLVLFDKRRESGEKVLQRILQRFQEFTPDLVFTVNHLGFDREGLLMEAFHRLKVPSISWYVDSPAIILNLYAGPKSDLAFIFVWDTTYIPEVQALGFANVFFLPLATDPVIFSPRPARELTPWRSEVAFVGNSLTGSVAAKLDRLPFSPEFLELFHRLLGAFKAQPFRRLEALLAAAGLEQHPLIRGLDRTGLTDLEAGIIWAATRDYRLDCLKRLAPFNPVIYGDPGWREVLDGHFQRRPEVNYFEELPLVYGATTINFNATSLQMKTAVNQRIFDAPAAGGFLLTDFRDQLAELLEVDREVVCYRDPAEIPDLVRFYLKHPSDRAGIVQKARARILAEHTYRHRVETMLDLVRRAS